ncbi:ABC transporter ATP-binding protein [Corynebacterium bovis]|uniref:Trehalose import ATP-binding protein SugC n=1 Tax=Corynebacterium bovis DSM 20582 = CIP 54.80 TaxID=927655 RepID=A0A8I0CND7_9CORY|nr:ATP-binding cassette domain-containing protein [Corynebacterium bovis]MBB3115320.1 multiple sugar transport system ATP-binding protein [Corynebacterium bovis DSM 20582 = CIP 54.80]RRO80345.1 ABC transporter [Corynebacterium bovis]RRO81648.1 ABC transporter [Corynebacterium bovis]RRO84202.1 ABC transporter [Corynebacterium bovis]RRO92726.1 ABC transporter [Corynebacterium bovis]
MSAIVFDNATLIHDNATTPSIDSLTLTVEDGEFMALVGPSGSGKSTTLRMIAGLEDVTSGAIRLGGRDVTGVAPADRDIAMVFQTYALYPHMTVGQNMEFALRMQGIDADERRTRVREVAALLGLADHLDRRPRDLSGGQRQRVAMGRAIARRPSVFLMDEPLSNLDAVLRVATRANIVDLQRRLGTTTVYVTHDQVEAMTMAHRIAVLADGRLQQVGTPRELYDRPGNLFVAGFLGSPSMNLLPLVLDGHGGATAHAGATTVAVPRDIREAAPTGRVTLGVRCEDLEFVTPDGPDADLTVTVRFVEDTGSDCYVRTVPGDQGVDDDHPVIVRTTRDAAPAAGTRVGLRIRPGAAHWFDTDGEGAIRP